MPVTIVHPGNESVPRAATPPPRLGSLKGKKIGLLDISKPGGSFFLDRIEQLLVERHRVASVLRIMKPTFAKPAPPDLLEKIRDVDAVIEGLAD